MSLPQQPEVGVGAVAVRDGSILLIRRGHAPSEGLWSIPGGRVQFGETLTEALRREVLEETRLQVKVGETAGVIERIYPDESVHYVIVDFFVEIISGVLQAGSDVTDAIWIPIADLDTLPLVPRLVESLRDFGVID